MVLGYLELRQSREAVSNLHMASFLSTKETWDDKLDLNATPG